MNNLIPDKCCRKCGSVISESDKFCTSCGVNLTLADENKDSSKITISDNECMSDEESGIPCPKCGGLVIDKNRFCNTCDMTIPFSKKERANFYRGLVILLIPVGLIILIVYIFSGPTYYTTLSKQEAGERCFSRYLESDLMSSKADIHFRDKMVLKVGENRYAARIKYTFNGQERYLNCGTYYLNNGEVWLKAYN